MKRSMLRSLHFNPPLLCNAATLFLGVKIFALYVRNTWRQHNFLVQLRAGRHKHTRSFANTPLSAAHLLHGKAQWDIDGHGQLRLPSVIRHCRVPSHLSPVAERASVENKPTALKRVTVSVAQRAGRSQCESVFRSSRFFIAPIRKFCCNAGNSSDALSD